MELGGYWTNSNFFCLLLYIERVDFYPSITKNLLKKTKNFAEAHILLLDDDKATISKTWIKGNSGLFDVTVGVYDSTNVSKLFGNYLFQALSKLYNKKTLYRNGRLEVFKNKN